MKRKHTELGGKVKASNVSKHKYDGTKLGKKALMQAKRYEGKIGVVIKKFVNKCYVMFDTNKIDFYYDELKKV